MKPFILSFFMLLSLSSLSLAQTTPPPLLQEAVKVNILTRPKILTSVPLNTPQPIDLGSLTVPGATSKLTDGVTVKAYVRYVEYKGKMIGQVVLTALEKNGKIEALPADGFSAQLDLSQPSLDPATDIIIKGNGSTIITSLEKLAKAAPVVAPTAAVAQQTQDTQAQKQTSGSTGSSNDQAAGYQTPSAVAVDKKPVETSRVTKDGCGFRPDFNALRAFQQSKTVNMTDGAITSESDCTDSFDSVPIDRSYAFCSYVEDLDLAVRTATAQYELIYIDATGIRKQVKPDGQAEYCKPDPEKVFSIVEAETSIFFDYANFKAVPQSRLIYMDDNNREIQVRGAQASETKLAVDLVPTLSGCAIRDEFKTGGTGTSFQQGTYTYTIDGITNQAGTCQDNGTTYPHSLEYTDAAGAALCAAVVDGSGRPIGLQNRIAITVNGIIQYITLCTPDTSGKVISATTNTCSNPMTWTHDVNAGISYEHERFFFNDGTKDVFLTVCQKSQTQHIHDYVTVGWEPNDAGLTAKAKTTVFITPSSGRYDVQVNQVLSGASDMPYQLTGTVEKEFGAPTYPSNDCNKFQPTTKFEQWKRPDTTIFEKDIGAGTLIAKGYSCTRNGADQAADWTATGGSSVSLWYYPEPGITSYGKARGVRSSTYQATRFLTRDDTTVILSETKTAVWSSCSTAQPANNKVAYHGQTPHWRSTAEAPWAANPPTCAANPPQGNIAAMKAAAQFLN